MLENNGGEPRGLTVEAAGTAIDALLAPKDETQDPPKPVEKQEPTLAAPVAPAPVSEEPPAPAPNEPPTPAEEPPASEPAPAASELVPFSIAGEEIKVPAKVREELEKGTLRQADYTRKTQATAEKAKELAAKEAEIEAERARLVKALEAAERVVQGEMPKEPDWNKLREQLDPVEFSAAVAEHQLAVRQYERLVETRQKEAEKVQAKQAKEYRAYLEAEQQKVLDAIPEWKEQKTRETEWNEITDYVVNTLGRSEQEARNITDASLVVVLRKAMKWDKAQAAAKTPKPATPAAPAPAPAPTIAPARPGPKPAAPLSERQKSFEKHRSAVKASGSVVDAGRAITAIIPD